MRMSQWMIFLKNGIRRDDLDPQTDDIETIADWGRATHAALLSIDGVRVVREDIMVIRDRKQLSTNPLVYTNIHGFEIPFWHKVIKIAKKRF